MDKLRQKLNDPRIPLVNMGFNNGSRYVNLDEDAQARGAAAPPGAGGDASGGLGAANYPNYQTWGTNERDRKKAMMAHVGYRLGKRKELYYKRRRLADLSLAIAIVGILLMVFETEMTFSHYYTKHAVSSVVVKTLITLSTLVTLILIICYHRVDIRIYCIDNSIDHWQTAMNRSRIITILLEILIVSIHPPPGTSYFEWETTHADTNAVKTSAVPVDVILSVPMFLRLYLVARTILLHSKLFADASSQSLGYLNRIDFNFRFVFKAYMSTSPESVLCGIIITLMVIASYAVRACEMYHDEEHMSYWNSVWLIAITFLTVGYGDIVPNTYCGRMISVFTGMIGVFCTALIVAVLAKKLELSRAEKYVNQFVTEVELAKKQKSSAANIVKYGWRIYRLKKRGLQASGESRMLQRKLLKAIRVLRDVKSEQRKLADNAVTILEISRSQDMLTNFIEKIGKTSSTVAKKVDTMEERLGGMEHHLQTIHEMVSSIYAARR